MMLTVLWIVLLLMPGRLAMVLFVLRDTEFDDAIDATERAETMHGPGRSFDDSLVPIVTERRRGATVRCASWAPDSRLETRLVCLGSTWRDPL